MDLVLIVAAAAAAVAALVLIAAYICYRMAFYSPKRKPNPDGGINLPQGAQYRPYWEKMRRWAEETRALPQRELSVRSFDGLTLRGTYYEYAPNAPIELMFHGYRGNAERDLSGGVQRCFKLKRSAFIVDQRCSGGSEGNVITFGINEHRDCLSWLELMQKRFPENKVILTGISMGASTVLLAGGCKLPENVIGILADCGFHSAKAIIKKVCRQIGLPAEICYPFIKLGAKLYGHFDLEETTPEEAMRHCTVPVIFFHGETDDYVPYEMSRISYEACVSRKKLVLVPGAGHGLSYPIDPERYLRELQEFFETEL